MTTHAVTSARTSVIVGLGKTGASCVRYLARRGIPAAVTDSRRDPPGLAELGGLAANLDLRLGGSICRCSTAPRRW